MISEPRQPIVTVFGGAHPKPDDPDYALAWSLGRTLAEAGFAIANGGYGGTMEAASGGAREAGGHTIGIVAGELYSPRANRHTVETIDAGTWFARMRKLIDVASGYAVLPGGTGTLAELAVVWEMVRKKLIPRRPMVAVGPAWRGVLESIETNLRGEDPEGLGGIERFDKAVWWAGDVEAAVSLLRREIGA